MRLETAFGLRLRGIENIFVIARTRAFTQVEQVINLLPKGLKAVKTLSFAAYEVEKKVEMRVSSPPRAIV